MNLSSLSRRVVVFAILSLAAVGCAAPEEEDEGAAEEVGEQESGLCTTKTLSSSGSIAGSVEYSKLIVQMVLEGGCKVKGGTPSKYRFYSARGTYGASVYCTCK